MKKRLFATALMLLAATLLFCSCAMGAFAPTFATVAGDRISDFIGNASNLLKNNVPLFLDGRINYTPVIAPEQARYTSSLFTAISEKTGVDFYQGGEMDAPKFRVGLDLVEGLQAPEYFIGFVGEDFVITAKNDAMLCEALRYFETNLVNGEQANAGEGYLYVPGDLSMKNETFLLFEGEEPLYTLVYPDGANEIIFSSVNILRSATQSSAGTMLTMESDFLSPESVKARHEILVGEVNREESIKAIEGLNRFSYYLGITENKIVIAASNPWTLKTATERFISIFGDEQRRITALPREFSLLVSIEE